MTKSMAMLPALFAFLMVSVAAKADVVVGARNPKYGTLIVVGNPSADCQNDTTYSVRVDTVGSHSEDAGSIDGNQVNAKLRLRAGQYTVFYAHNHKHIEIRSNETTLVKLQKVSAAPMENTATVALLSSREPTEDDSSTFENVGTWERETTKSVPAEKTCHVGTGYGFFGIPTPKEYCSDGYKIVPVIRSWKSAFFYVLPGTYSMLWTFKDGTTHQEDSIEVAEEK